MTRTIASALVIAAALLGAACGGDMGGTAPSAERPDGEYFLEDIDQVALPARVFRGAGVDPLSGRYYNQLTLVVNGGEIDFFSAERFVMNLELTRTLDGVTRNTPFYATGTYEVDGEDISFVGDDGIEGEFFGVLRNGVLSISVDLADSGGANQYAFRK